MSQDSLHPDKLLPKRSVQVRLNDFYEIYGVTDHAKVESEASRCMNCGSPFCQTDSNWQAGCPINNRIPEWNALVGQGRWREAYERLSVTNNFPEFTGRICPAPCQEACIHEINDEAIQIKPIEKSIIDKAWDEGWVEARIPTHRTGKSVAIIGSGPAGLAAADQLNQAGYQITVYERAHRPGGLLMYGVPNMKLDKAIVKRRIAMLEAEGIQFLTGVHVGVDITVDEIKKNHDAVLLATGATKARELMIEGADGQGVVQAMPYLTHSTQQHEQSLPMEPVFDAAGRNVVIIGAGDTATDCIATAVRQGCDDLICLSRSAQAESSRVSQRQWPAEARRFEVDYGHAEAMHYLGVDPRHYEVEPHRILCDEQGNVTGVEILARSEQGELKAVIPADLVILAMGFVGSEHPLAEAFGVELNDRGSIEADDKDYATNVPGVFVAGDARRGASLVVWAIREGRQAADSVKAYLSQDQSIAVDASSVRDDESLQEHMAA